MKVFGTPDSIRGAGPDAAAAPGGPGTTGAPTVTPPPAAMPETAGRVLPGAPGRARPGVWLGALLVLALVAVAYAPTFHTLARTWTHNDNYSHGLIIPPITLFLLWMRRDALRSAPREPSALGLPLVALGLLIHVAGIRGDLTMVQGHSFVLVALGLILHFFGRRVTRLALFPVAYLVFMSPFPPVFADELSFRLKLWVISGSLRAVSAMGIPVVREGMTLHLPVGAVSIEDPCSGLRSLIALLALATLIAAFSRAGAIRRSVLVLTAIPVAMVANFIRITLIVLASNYLGLAIGTGVVHDISGYVLFAVGIAGLFAVKAVLRC